VKVFQVAAASAGAIHQCAVFFKLAFFYQFVTEVMVEQVALRLVLPAIAGTLRRGSVLFAA
jgi:hypothetical protein